MGEKRRRKEEKEALIGAAFVKLCIMLTGM